MIAYFIEKRYGMTGKALLPMGIENFKEIRTAKYYYVDKTGLIQSLLEHFGKVKLFTRPRRFGKTLNMSMLKYFLRQAVTVHFLMVLRFQRRENFVTNIWESFL